MELLLRDLAFSLRHLRKSPGFTAIVVLTLALGIGADTAIFSVVDAVLLRPLPYRAPDRLVVVNHYYHSPVMNDLEAGVSAIGFRTYAARNRSFDAVAVTTPKSYNLTGAGDPERIPGAQVSGDYFRVLGVSARLGRTIQGDDAVAGHDKVVLLGDGMWRRVFGADPRIVGRTVQLNGEGYLVLGVMPPAFRDAFDRTVQLWTPLVIDPAMFDVRRFGNEFLSLVARLKPGVTLAQAQADMHAVADQIKHDYPANRPSYWTLKVTALPAIATRSVRPALLVLIGAVGFVLLIACANVANLLLARAAVRLKEIAIRAALGASRGALVRQLLVESLVLAVMGGVLGIAVAWWAVRVVVSLVPELPRADGIGIDARVLAFTLVLSVITGLLFGLVPALRTSRTRLQETLREGGRTGTADFSGRATRRALVVAEMALALTLLVGAGLLIRSVERLTAVNPGFDPHGLLTFSVALPAVKYPSDTAQIAFYDRMLQAVRTAPGVTDAGGSTTLPFSGGWSTSSFAIEGRTQAPNEPEPWGDARIASPGFFRTMRMPIEQGRDFDEHDRIGGQKVAVVDEHYVREFSQGRSPIGTRIAYGNVPGDTVPDWITIVGVVGHSMQEALDAKPRPQVYRSDLQRGVPFISVVVRTRGDPLAVVPAVRRAIRDIDPDVPMSSIRTMDDMMAASMGSRRLTMFLLAAFSAVALLLASLGIYGVIAYSVAQRQRELGIRMALGAARGRVLALVLGQGMALAAAGIVAGVAASLALTRLLGSQLYDVRATDPATFGVVTLVLASVALAATAVPALRATRVDPVVALHAD